MGLFLLLRTARFLFYVRAARLVFSRCDNAATEPKGLQMTKSRQVQLRRGTAAQHETFIGAEGEVTVDTTNHTLRVHDGITPGGNIVSSNQIISDNFLVPDYSNAITFNFTSLNTAPEDGFFEISGLAYFPVNLTIKLNDIEKTFASSSNNGYSCTGYMILPVKAGDTIQGLTCHNNNGHISFLPIRKTQSPQE